MDMTVSVFPGTCDETCAAACSYDGDVNGDTLVNVQDVILMVNLILTNQYDSSADLNTDNIVNVQDVVRLVNIILN